MASLALRIRDAIIGLLTQPALAGIGPGGVVTDPDYAFEARDLPAVAVYLGDASADRDLIIGSIDRKQTVTVRAIGKGDDAQAAHDALLVAVHGRLAGFRDTSLFYDLAEGATRRNRDVLQVPVAYTEIDFEISYRTAVSSLE